MKRIPLLVIFFGLFWFFENACFASDLKSGDVSGVIRVQKARVKTQGPKSFKDVVIYLEPLGSQAPIPPPSARHAVMDQRGLIFIPHVMAVQNGTTVDFLNSDNDRHNVYFLFDKTGETLDIGTWGPGQSVSHTFQNSGLVITLCQLHLEMAAYILVLDTPFFTVAEIDEKSQEGTFQIGGVPPGEYRLHAWHKKLKPKGGAIKIAVTPGNRSAVDLVITQKKYAQ